MEAKPAILNKTTLFLRFFVLKIATKEFQQKVSQHSEAEDKKT